VSEMDVRGRLPRPRASDDAALWTLAREAIGLLSAGAQEPGETPPSLSPASARPS